MKPIKISELPVAPTPLGGRARTLVNHANLRLVSLILEPGETVRSHTAPVDVVFIIEEGSGKIMAGQEEIAFQTGELIICPAEIDRSVEAGSLGARLLVVRAPNL